MKYRFLFLALALAGCIDPNPPGPKPPRPEPDVVIENISDVARASTIRFSAELAATCDAAVAELKAGRIKDGSALNKFMRERNDQARQQSFSALHTLWNNSFGEDRFSPDAAISSLTDTAKGFRRVK